MYTTSLPPVNKIVKPTPLKLAINLNIYYNMSNMETLLRKIIDAESSYEPGPETCMTLGTSGLVAFTGQIAGTGKDTIKDGVAKALGGEVFASLTTRPKRESDNGDYNYVGHEELLDMIAKRRLAEFTAIRGRYVYATPSASIEEIAGRGKIPCKDIELVGLQKLRHAAGASGAIKAIYPLPDLAVFGDGTDRTGWEAMLTDRDYNGLRFAKVLKGELGPDKANDLRQRLQVARGQLDQVLSMGLSGQEGTFFPVNKYGNPQVAVDEAVEQLTMNEEDPITRFSYDINVKTQLLHLQKLVDNVFTEAT